MGYIELTFCGDWTELPELNTRFQVSFLPADPEFVEDVRFVGGRAECLEPEDLAMIAEHTGIIHAELSFDGGDKYKAAIEAIELARTLFANGGTGLFIETATKVFTPRTLAEMSTNEPRILFHFLVEVFGNQTAIMTAGMSAFQLPDIRVPYTKKTSQAAQAAAFGIAAQMVCDGFQPTIGGFFKNTESAPVFSTRKVKPPGHDNQLGCWELKIT